MDEIDEDTRISLYTWIDGIPLSKTKKDIGKDFSDGYLVAEVIKHFLPKYVELHNYQNPANSSENKEYNWRTLNKKVFMKMGFQLNESVIHKLKNAHTSTVEYFLLMLKDKIENAKITKSPRIKRRTDRKDKPDGYQLIGSTNGKDTRQLPDTSRHDRYYYLRPDPGIERISMHDLDRRDHATAVKQKVIQTIAESDNVPRILYEEKERESRELDRKIEEIEYKIHGLERLISLKDLRILSTAQQIYDLDPSEIPPEIRLKEEFGPGKMYELGNSTFRKGN